MRRRLHGLLAVLVATTMVATGCGFDPGDHPMPGTGVSGPTYRLAVEFSSLLSLPAGAQVRSNGAKVGSLRSISLTADAAVAHIEVSRDVDLPRGTRAELRQTSILGDIYLALIPPADTGALLRDGDTIPIADTDTGPNVEQMLMRMADFVNAGSLTRLQDAIDRLNDVLPTDESDTRRLASFGGEVIEDLAEGIDHLDRTVAAGLDATRRLDAIEEKVTFIFSDTARRRLELVPEFMTAVLNLVIDVNTLTTGLEWLIPRLPKVNDFLEDAVPLVRTPTPHAYQFGGNSGAAIALVEDELIPFLLGPTVDIDTVSLASGTDVSSDALVLLTMAGILR